MSGTVILIVLGALLFLGAITIGILWLVRKLIAGGSGWQRLATRYEMRQPLSDQPVSTGKTMVVGVVRFRNSMTVGVWPQGLYLASVMSRPALLIPWSDFSSVSKTRYYMQDALRITIGNPPQGEITVFMDLYTAMYPYLNQRDE